jgi:hypothetical protein
MTVGRATYEPGWKWSLPWGNRLEFVAAKMAR